MQDLFKVNMVSIKKQTKKIAKILTVAKKPKKVKEDFNYVVKRQPKARICFGSGLERQTLEGDKKGMVSRHVRSHIKENIPTLSPEMYGIQPQTTALYRVMNKPISKLGTVLGGRTSERKLSATVNLISPAPNKYKIPSSIPDEFRQNPAPFNVATTRKPLMTSKSPGVGHYKVAPYKHRTIPFAYCLGGKRTLIPAVEMKCGPVNSDTCEICEQSPEGDYWSMITLESKMLRQKCKEKGKAQSEGIFLCRDCYETERKENKMFTKLQMELFKKVRDCSGVHFHGGCEAKVFLVPPREIAKMREREGYLGVYFS